MDIFDRILRDRGYVPFQREPWINPRTGRRDSRVLGERPPLRWRVARDFWNEFCAPLVPDPDAMGLEFGGWPVEPDDTLAPGAVVLDEAPG